MIRGKYEEPLILAVEQYFRDMNYQTYLHAQLNISWSNIISDVDLLAIKGNDIIAVEVKSKKDIFTNAFKQLEKIVPFIDKAFITTDDEIVANKYRKINLPYGILYIDLIYGDIVTKKNAKKYKEEYSVQHLCSLRKCCLQELAREWKIAPF